LAKLLEDWFFADTPAAACAAMQAAEFAWQIARLFCALLNSFQEAVLKDIDFVDVFLAPETGPVIPHITNLNDGILA